MLVPAADASPIDHVGGDAAAFLIMHGIRDKILVCRAASAQQVVVGGCFFELHVPKVGTWWSVIQDRRGKAESSSFFSAKFDEELAPGKRTSGQISSLYSTAPVQYVVREEDQMEDLPGTGQSTVVWGDRLFFTTMKPVQNDATLVLISSHGAVTQTQDAWFETVGG